MIYYVYMYFDENAIPRYVGKGRKRRYLPRKKLKGTASSKLIEMILRNNEDFPIVIVKENMEEREALDLEEALILIIGREDLGTGPLYNLKNGGQNGVGYVYTEEQIQKRRLLCSNLGKSRADTKWTENQRKRQLESWTPERKENHSKRHLELWIRSLRNTDLRLK